MYHSITFGSKNTWDDWHLIPKSRPVFNPPPVKTHFVEIPGGDGAIDLSTALAGRPLFGNRTGSFEFYAENGFKDWSALYSEIMVYLHGQKMRAVLEDDPAYFYEGRFTVNAWKSEQQRSTIVIDYNVNPYKRDTRASDEDWIWDTFNFETGIVRYYKDLIVTNRLDLVIIGDVMPAIPTIIASASGMSVEFNGIGQSLDKGENVISSIKIQNGENLVSFFGNGKITIKLIGGRL